MKYSKVYRKIRKPKKFNGNSNIVKDEFDIDGLIRSINKLTEKSIQYDVLVEETNKVVLDITPEKAMVVSSNYTRSLYGKIADLRELQERLRVGRISWNEYVEQIRIKKQEIESLRVEVGRLEGTDNFQSSIITYLINSLVDTLYYRYFEVKTPDGRYNRIMFCNLTRDLQIDILNEMYDKYSVISMNFDRDTFINNSCERIDFMDISGRKPKKFQ